MFHSILFERPRRTLLVSMFGVAVLLSVVLYGAIGSAEKSGNSDFSSRGISSGRNLGWTLGAGASRPASRGVSSFFASRLRSGNLQMPFASTITVNSTAQNPGALGDCTL